MKILIAYDGSLNAQAALRYGMGKFRKEEDTLTVLHVFHRAMFIDYGAGPNAEETARAEASRFTEEARKIVSDSAGASRTGVFSIEGVPEEEIERYARQEGADLILAPPGYRSIAKSSPCPVSIIPGAILVPMDNSPVSDSTIDRIAAEAKATYSKVVLLGIVPVHLYSAWERKEVDALRKETASAMKKTKKLLSGRDIEVKELIRSGYPDEEIIKVAEDFPVMMIIIPAAGEKPSELTKAAAIIMDEEEIPRRPVVLMEEAAPDRA